MKQPAEFYLEMMNTDSLLQWEQGQTEPLPRFLLCDWLMKQSTITNIDPGVVSARRQLTDDAVCTGDNRQCVSVWWSLLTFDGQ